VPPSTGGPLVAGAALLSGGAYCGEAIFGFGFWLRVTTARQSQEQGGGCE
jgi:hypothetical protein